jgi:hypothetical protein
MTLNDLFNLLRIRSLADVPQILLSSLSPAEQAIACIGTHSPIPPSKTGRIIIYESLMMEIMVIGTSPKGDKLIK